MLDEEERHQQIVCTSYLTEEEHQLLGSLPRLSPYYDRLCAKIRIVHALSRDAYERALNMIEDLAEWKKPIGTMVLYSWPKGKRGRSLSQWCRDSPFTALGLFAVLVKLRAEAKSARLVVCDSGRNDDTQRLCIVSEF